MRITPELIQRVMLARPPIEAMCNWVADELNRLAGIEALVGSAREVELGAAREYERATEEARGVRREAMADCPHYTCDGNRTCDVCGKVMYR